MASKHWRNLSDSQRSSIFYLRYAKFAHKQGKAEEIVWRCLFEAAYAINQ